MRPTLYRALLGESFERLPPALRAFHDLPEGACAAGPLRVTRGAGRLRSIAADLMRLPGASACVPARLEVLPEGDHDRWIRHFGSHRIQTRQWRHGSLLVEAAGPLRFGMRLVATDRALRFEFARGWLGPMPLPRRLCVRVDADATGADDGWRIDVRVSAPVLGLLVRYEGLVTPA